MYANGRAAVRGGIDETLSLKDEQGFPNRRATHAELTRELLLLQARSWRKSTVHDRPTYDLCDGNARVSGELLAFLGDLRHARDNIVCNPD